MAFQQFLSGKRFARIAQRFALRIAGPSKHRAEEELSGPVALLFLASGSFLLTVRSFVLRFGVCCLFCKLVWSSSRLKFGFGLFCLMWKLGLVFFTYGSPCPKIGFGLYYFWFPRHK